MAEMPKYRCHKDVWALKIKEVRQSPREPAVAGGTWEIVPEDERYAPITISHEFYTKHRPIAGGYYVVYKDGYKSYSPAEAFDGGYTRVKDGGLSFGDALEAIKRGKRVARIGWNGKGMWLSLSANESDTPFVLARSIPAESFWSNNNRRYAEEQGGFATVLPCITMKTATGEILMGWLASQTDMLAEDWVVL